MATVSMLELRKNAHRILMRAHRGERMVITYRGKALARLEPATAERVCEEDPFYGISRIAESGGGSLSNRAMDRIVYEE